MRDGDHSFRRADELFDLALDVAPGERAAFVASQAAGDDELCALVLRLLGHADGGVPELQPGGAMDTTIGLRVTDALAGVPSLLGQRIGRYRVIRELGRGGMAVVFLAERHDGDFNQQVALKLIQDRFPGPGAIARFERERQILADARHPNLAALLDGGTTDDGRPYLVMELVEGRPIDEYCDRERLTVRARLGLFQQVARAVEHAHRNLVVHRDIKPSNILVTADGTVKLLDFGIAKLLDDAGDHAVLTHTDDRPMTPAFASPEQVKGEAVTTASDIYQLGVLLYQLLTGQWPYRADRTSGAAAMLAIMNQPPRRPSTVVAGRRSGAPAQTLDRDSIEPSCDSQAIAAARATTTRRLRAELAGDLDVILLSALRKEPERRYPSVGRLIDDVESVLAHRPVSARGDSLAYRASRFVRRHAAASLVATVAAAAIAGLVSLHLVEVGRERDIARAEAAKANQAAQFLRSLFEVASPTRSQGEQVTARELLDSGAARIERELAAEPALLAELETVIGDVYRDLGLYDEARAIVERAVALRREHPGQDGLDLASSLVVLGRVHEKRREGTAGIAALEEAVAIRRRALGPEHADVARAEEALGLLYMVEGELDRALELERHAAAVLERELGPDDVDLGHALNHLATALQDLRRYPESLATYERAHRIFENALGKNHPLTAGVTVNMAFSARHAGDVARAEELYRIGLERIEAVYGPAHPNVGVVLNNLANLVRAEGRLDEAEELHQRTLALWTAAFGADHDQVTYSLNNLGLIERDRGNHEAARRYFERTVTILEGNHEADHQEVATPLLNLGTELIDLGRSQEAVPLIERAIAIRARVYGPDHSFLGAPNCRLGEIALARGRLDEAERYFKRAAELARGEGDERDTETTRAAVGLARLVAARGDIAAARTTLGRELELAQDEDRHFVAEALAELGAGTGATIEPDHVDNARGTS